MRAPLTMAQRGRVLASAGGNGRAPEVFGLLLDRPVPADQVHMAVNRVANAHTALRYQFPDATGAAAELVRQVDVPLLVADDEPDLPDTRRLRSPPGFRDALTAPFDLGLAPLLRAAMVPLDGRTLIWFAVEHIVFDAASVALFVADLARVFGHLVTGGSVDAGVPAGSDFTQFARQEADWLSSPQRRNTERFWAEVWGRLGPFPELGTGRRQTVTPDADAMSIRTVALDGAALARTRTRRTGRRVPVLTLLASATSVALGELGETGRSGAVVQFARRDTPGARGTIGYINNRLLLPLDFRPTRAIDQIVDEVDTSVTAAVRHGMMPFEQMAERWSGPGAGRPLTPPPPHLYLNTVAHLSRPQAGVGVEIVRPEPITLGVRPEAAVTRLALQILEVTRGEPVLSIVHHPAVFDDDAVGYVEQRIPWLMQGRTDRTR